MEVAGASAGEFGGGEDDCISWDSVCAGDSRGNVVVDIRLLTQPISPAAKKSETGGGRSTQPDSGSAEGGPVLGTSSAELIVGGGGGEEASSEGSPLELEFISIEGSCWDFGRGEGSAIG